MLRQPIRTCLSPRILTCYYQAKRSGNYHHITPCDWKSCDRQRTVWLPRVLSSLCLTPPRLMLMQSFYTSQKPGTLADLAISWKGPSEGRLRSALLGMCFVRSKKKDNSVSVQGLIIRSHKRIGINIIILRILYIWIEVRQNPRRAGKDLSCLPSRSNCWAHGREANSQKDHWALHLEWDSQRCERNGMLLYHVIFCEICEAVILMAMFIIMYSY